MLDSARDRAGLAARFRPLDRWQALRDLADAPAEVVAAERARVATEGWGAPAGLAGRRRPVEGGALFPARRGVHPPAATRPSGRGPAPGLRRSPPHAATCARGRPGLRTGATGRGAGPRPLPLGRRPAVLRREVEAVYQRRTVALGVYFGHDVEGIVARLLGEQLEDGGWNCEAENGSVRSSFDTTINVLEGLLAHEQPRRLRRHRSRRDAGAKRTSSNESCSAQGNGDVVSGLAALRVPDPLALRRAACPRVLPRSGDPPGRQVDEAMHLLRSRQQPDGTWLLENTPSAASISCSKTAMAGPARWNTLRALRVLGGTSNRAPERPAGARHVSAPAGDSSSTQQVRTATCSSAHTEI